MGGVEICPGIEYRENFCRIQIGQGEVVEGREGDDVAFAGNGFSMKEQRLET